MEKDNRQRLVSALATRANVTFSDISNWLPNPNLLFVEAGGKKNCFDNITLDSHVSSCIQSRKYGVLSLDHEIQGKDKKLTELIQKTLDKVNLKNLINDILNAPLNGYQVLEIVWWLETIDNTEYYLPTAIIAKPFDWFIFDKFNQPLMVTKDKPEGQHLPQHKFLVVQSNPSYLNPYGDPVLSKCLWPIVFKKGGLTFWMKFMEKHGIPKYIGKTDSIDDTDLALFQAQIDALIQDASAVIGKEEEINMLTATGSVGVNLYKELIEFCNTEISKAILSTTLTTEIQGGGSYAAGKVHAEIREDIVDADKLLVEQTINQLISWIAELNFNNINEPPKFVMFPKEDVDRPLAEVVDLITKNNQIAFTEKFYMNRFGFKKDEFKIIDNNSAPQLSAQPQTIEKEKTDSNDNDNDNFSAFAEKKTVSEQILVDAFGDKILDLGEKDFANAAQSLFALVNKSKSFEEVKNNLASILKDMDTSQIEKNLVNILFLNDVLGRVSVAQENKI